MTEPAGTVRVKLPSRSVMVPLVVYASGKKINLKYYEDTNNRWLNYLGGIAIVFKPDGTRVFYVVKGLDSGTM